MKQVVEHDPAWMCLQPGFYVSAAVGVEIVHDEVDDLTLGYALIEQVEEEGEEDCLLSRLADVGVRATAKAMNCKPWPGIPTAARSWAGWPGAPIGAPARR